MFNKNTPYRFERKFTASAAHPSFIVTKIKRHPAFFKEIYEQRQINNIYFDTPSYHFYKDNVIGIAQRKKIRIRWYGSLEGQVISPKLEYKIKAGLVGTKWTFDLIDFPLNHPITKDSLFKIFNASDLPDAIMEDLNSVAPTLLNTYQRNYFLSADKKYRLTFDQGLSFYPIAPTNKQLPKPVEQKNRYVLELKYAKTEDTHANKIASLFPYRLDKSSKYVSGIELTRK